MNENAGQFRTAAFGGFNRQDVLDYIEKLTQENQEKSLELERALEREETVRAQSEARFAEAEEQAAACEKLSEEVEQLRKDLAETKSALEEKTRLASDLQKQVRDLEPEAKSWQRLKDTAGDIEVSAHERAQVTIQNAQSHAPRSAPTAPAGSWRSKPAATSSGRICAAPSPPSRRSWTASATPSAAPSRTWTTSKTPSPTWSPAQGRIRIRSTDLSYIATE